MKILKRLGLIIGIASFPLWACPVWILTGKNYVDIIDSWLKANEQ